MTHYVHSSSAMCLGLLSALLCNAQNTVQNTHRYKRVSDVRISNLSNGIIQHVNAGSTVFVGSDIPF